MEPRLGTEKLNTLNPQCDLPLAPAVLSAECMVHPNDQRIAELIEPFKERGT